jgi:hypothetical protein
MSGMGRRHRLNRLQGDDLTHLVVGSADAGVGDEAAVCDATEVVLVHVEGANILGHPVRAVDTAGARDAHERADRPRGDVARAAEVVVLAKRDAVPKVERHDPAGVDCLLRVVEARPGAHAERVSRPRHGLDGGRRGDPIQQSRAKVDDTHTDAGDDQDGQTQDRFRPARC